jgi:hypothetical protein
MALVVYESEHDMSKNAAYLARKQEKAARRNRERFTGWSHEDYQAAFIKQKGCCAMCKMCSILCLTLHQRNAGVPV